MFGGDGSGRTNFLHVVVRQRFGDRRRREAIPADFGCGSNLRFQAGLAASGEAAQLFREECSFDDFDAATFGELNHGSAGDAVQEAIQVGA
ncbi:hypothetical protein [Rhizobium viscosum]|uniref:Uncharacterized protein n=1 Tax=Rhizobium viscosum TaxID=1673 RepID=A0ABR9IS05_RHIVS|nr:hypothetical protein [Rhizobium viscosum]MBE1505985.1 hypothetical protein [Rhizobium viscosum]